ncbi:MAG TPA: MerR family transcriptional regulator [Streptosporangiaceae bacterium]|nr:MerR family transcriptional regulator [Streptosporangiaceae bacterium]
MPGSLTIGDFSRATFLSVKTLRHYHRVGLLEPADVDPVTGYRHYSSEQIPTAQVIRRFRDLSMPLEEIGSVLRAPDQATRSQLIAAHLTRLEQSLTQTQRAVASLRDLLEHPSPPAVIEHRRVPATQAAAVMTTVDAGDLAAWYQGAIGEIRGTLSAQGIVCCGPPGGIFASELFSRERGEATLFVPVSSEVRPVGRVVPFIAPRAELAVINHTGSHSDVDRSYGALATYVSERALGVDGPVREYYLVGRHDTDDEQAWRTEIGWPIFDVAPGHG